MKIFFKNWLMNEISRNLEELPLNKINLNKLNKPRFEEEYFDEEEALESCIRKYNLKYYDPHEYGKFFDNIEEDRNFSGVHVRDWEDDNHKPEEDDFDTKEEFDEALEAWEEERKEIIQDYYSYLEDWEEENKRNYNKAIELAEEEREFEIKYCLRKKREAHEEEQRERRERHEREKAEEGYDSEFDYQGQNFKVEIIKKQFNLPVHDSFHKIPLKNIYEINFLGPKDYKTTNLNSVGAASQIYAHLIASIVKMVQREKEEGNQINGFYFSASESKMIPIYNMFYRNYLQPQGYLKIDDFYLNESYFEEIIKDLGTEEKEEVLNKIAYITQQDKSNLQKSKMFKNNMRNIQRLFGKIVLFSVFNKERAGLVTGLKKLGLDVDAKIESIYDDPSFPGRLPGRLFFVPYEDVDLRRQPTEEQIVKLLQGLKNREDLKNAIPGFREMLTKYVP
jgi:hypothetical protein